MKNPISTVQVFLSSVGYCIALSWRSSKIYTAVRLLGKVIRPVMGIISAFLLKYIMDLLSGALIVTDKEITLTLLVALTALIALLTAAVQKAVSYAEGMHNDIIDRHITLGMMDKALTADLSLFDNPTYYDKLTSVKRDSYATGYILWNALDCVSNFVTFIGAFAVLCTSNWLYGIVMVITAFPSAIAGQKYTKILYQLGLTQINEERQKSYLYEVSSNKRFAQDVRLFEIGTILKKRYKSIWKNVFDAKKKKIKARTVITTLLEFLPELAIAFITLDISFKVLNGGSTIGDYSLYTGLLSQLWGSIYMLTNSAVSIYENKLKIDNVKSFEGIKSSVPDNGKKTLSSVDTIEFSRVCFSYPQTDIKVLDDISFYINKGEHMALVGVNGAGKTTLIKLLLRFYDADKGEVLLNGINIKEYTITSVRRCFSCYFQNTPNYGFTLRENITLADPDKPHDDATLLAALHESDGDNILQNHPTGLDTYITRSFEESGIELSGGQEQKIALARTFYRDSTALILDEPSSSLDPEAEHRLFEALEKLCKGKTTLFTSHRLSNITMADRIIVIENGHVIEIGTREELLSNPQRFAELYQYQAEKFKQ